MSRLVSLRAGLLLALATLTNAQSTLPKAPPCRFRGHDSRLRGEISGMAACRRKSRHSHPGHRLPGIEQPGSHRRLSIVSRRGRPMRGTPTTSYALTGHDAEFGKLEGRPVEVAGPVAPPLGDVRSGRMAGAADGSQRIHVSW